VDALSIPFSTTLIPTGCSSVMTAGECYVKGSQKTICCYGIIMKHNLCITSDANTFASLHRTANKVYRISCLVMGLLAFLACARKLYIIHRTRGSFIQRWSFRLLMVASLTFVARSPDPQSYEFIYSPVVSGLFSDICSACIYSVIVLYGAFYARLVVNPADLTISEHYIRGFMGLALFLSWFVFVVVRPAYLLHDPRNIYYSWHILMQFSMAPLLLFVLSTTALYFGLLIYRRLLWIRRVNDRAAEIALIRRAAAKPQSDMAVQNSISSEVDIAMLDKTPKSSNSRLLMVVIAVELISIVVMALHIWHLVQFVRDGCKLHAEFLCATDTNGDCTSKSFPFQVPYMCIVQYCSIILFYWSFHRTKHEAVESSNASITPQSRSLGVL
ncbi:unnamed protein product, partial [Aphanomyces euteiches]